MGKVVKTLVMVAAAAGIAYVSGGLAIGILGVGASSAAVAAATFAVSAALTVAAGVAFRFIFKPSRVKAPPWATVEGPAGRSNKHLADTMPPVPMPLPMRLIPGLWGRFEFIKNVGCCMGELSPDGSFALVDRKATLRSGDLMTLEQLPLTGWGPMVKRFEGIAGDRLEYSCDVPDKRFVTGRSNILYGYRVRAVAATRRGIWKAMFAIRRDDALFDERLGIKGGNKHVKDT